MKSIPIKDLKDMENLKHKAIEILEALKNKLDELADRAEEYYDDRSEKWQESDNGTFYSEWYEAIREKAYEIENTLDEVTDIEFEDIQKPPMA